MRNVVIGLTIGLVIGVVLGVTVLTPKLKTHAASKAVLSERDLKQAQAKTAIPLPSLRDGDAVHWRSAPPFPSDRPNVGEQARDFAKQLALLSGDKMILPVSAAKEVIEAPKLFAAIASGRIDALFATADIGVDKEAALAIYSALPFGPAPQEALAWIQAGNGKKYLRDIFAQHNITALVCGYLPPEAAGWFNKELDSTERLKELRIRIDGLGAKVWAKAGAQVVNIPAEEVPAAFDQDQLDAAVYSTPAQDAKTGFAKYAKNYYFPGWQNQGQPLLLLVNTRAWKKMDQERQSLLTAACDQHTAQTFANAAQEQFVGLGELAKQEVLLKRLPGFMIDRLKEAWEQVLAEEVRKNKNFLEVWSDLNNFLKNRKTWMDMSRLRNQEPDF